MTLTDGSSRWCSRLRGDDEGLKMVSPGRGCERCLTSGGGWGGGGAADDDDMGSPWDCWNSGDPIPP